MLCTVLLKLPWEMADESPHQSARMSKAQECNGRQLDPPCHLLSQPGVTMPDGMLGKYDCY